jgi:hypothetical protein
VEVGHVRNQLRGAIDAARHRAQARREHIAQAEQSFAAFLERATPVLRQLTTALRSESLAFTLFTPEHALRLASDRSRVDFIELTLDATADPPVVVLHSSYARGSRTLDEERPLATGRWPHEISDDELLAQLLQALAPWLER